MRVQMPPKFLLRKENALMYARYGGQLTKSQICDCIELITGASLSDKERKQTKATLLQILAAVSKDS